MSRGVCSATDGDQLRVLDPFAGSGSTLAAARRLGHRCVGIELDEGSCRHAAARFDQQTINL